MMPPINSLYSIQLSPISQKGVSHFIFVSECRFSFKWGGLPIAFFRGSVSISPSHTSILSS